MPTWEYKVMSAQSGPNMKEFPPKADPEAFEHPEKMLEREAQAGWELVSVVAFLHEGLNNWVKEFYFKRPVKTPQTEAERLTTTR